MYAIQTSKVDQSEIPALILVATNKVHALRLAEKNRLGEITSLLPVIVFILAMEGRLASLLNTCKSGNLPPADQHEFSSLITGYFVSDGSDPEWSDNECSSEPDVEIHSLCVFHCLVCTELD